MEALIVPGIVFVITALVKHFVAQPRLSTQVRQIALPVLAVVLVFVAHWTGLAEASNLGELIALALTPTGFHKILKSVFRLNV